MPSYRRCWKWPVVIWRNNWEPQREADQPRLTRRYLQAQLRDRDYEVFALLMLDNQHRVLKYSELFHGTIDGAAVYPREGEAGAGAQRRRRDSGA